MNGCELMFDDDDDGLLMSMLFEKNTLLLTEDF